MSYILASFNGFIYGSIIGATEGDIRSLDYGLASMLAFWFHSFLPLHSTELKSSIRVECSVRLPGNHGTQAPKGD